MSGPQISAIRFACKRAGRGLCTDCGDPVPHLEGRWARCSACIRKRWDRYPAKAQKDADKKRQAYAATIDGRCTACSRPAIAGRKKCQRCLDLNAAAQARRKAKLHGSSAP